MTEKELRKLSRRQLLELLLKQAEKVEILEGKLREAEDKINDRKIEASEAGTIAEAALRLNGVFAAADAAVDQYLENIKLMNEKQESLMAEAEAEARKRSEEILLETEKRCRLREAKAEKIVRLAYSKLSEMYKQKKSLDKIFKDYAVKHEEGKE